MHGLPVQGIWINPINRRIRQTVARRQQWWNEQSGSYEPDWRDSHFARLEWLWDEHWTRFTARGQRLCKHGPAVHVGDGFMFCEDCGLEWNAADERYHAWRSK